MSDGFPNKPKILRGAFVEFGLSLPPLVVVFQFNPLQLTRNRSLLVRGSEPARRRPAAAPASQAPTRTLRQFHGQFSDLLDLQKQQLVTVQEQTINFDIRLDATDKLNEGDTITEQFGIAPQISTLEQMVYPKEREPARRALVSALLGRLEGLQLHPRRQSAAGPVHLRAQARAAGQHQQHEHHRNRVQHGSEPDPRQRRREPDGDRGQERAVPVFQGHDRGDVGPEPGQYRQTSPTW